MIDISFCIPIYNAKMYIGNCLDSITEQGLDKYEIICVDDGSTDGTLEYVYNRSKLDQRIRVIKNPINKGVSFSRNVALSNARGKYVWFVDADDLVTPDAALFLLKTAEERKADIVLGKCYSFAEEKRPLAIKQGSGDILSVDLSKPESLYQTDQYGITCFGIWLGIYSRSFLIDHNIYFHEKFPLDEDIMFYLETIMESPKRLLVNFYSYFYRLRSDSACRSAVHSDDLHKKYCTCDINAVELILSNPNIYAPQYQEVINDFIIGRKENCMSHLVKVSDHIWVRRKMLELKKLGFYPYKQVPNVSFKKRKKINDWLCYEPIFWLVHLAYTVSLKVRNRG